MRAPGRAVGGGRCADAARPRDKRRKRPDGRIGSLVDARIESVSSPLARPPQLRESKTGKHEIDETSNVVATFFSGRASAVTRHGGACQGAYTRCGKTTGRDCAAWDCDGRLSARSSAGTSPVGTMKLQSLVLSSSSQLAASARGRHYDSSSSSNKKNLPVRREQPDKIESFHGFSFRNPRLDLRLALSHAKTDGCHHG